MGAKFDCAAMICFPASPPFLGFGHEGNMPPGRPGFCAQPHRTTPLGLHNKTPYLSIFYAFWLLSERHAERGGNGSAQIAPNFNMAIWHDRC